MAKATAKTAAPAEETTALATVDQTTTALSTEVDIDFAGDAAEFGNNFTREDFQMPFLQVIQSNSPQLEEGGPKYIDGAKAGAILETATNTVYDVKKKPLRLIFVSYRKTFVEWVTRDAGGGFVKDHGGEGSKQYQQCVKDDRGRMIVPSSDGKNQLVETMQYVVLFENAGGDWNPAIFSLTSTQLKKGRILNTQIEGLRIDVKGRKIPAPMFYSVFTLTTVPEKNDRGSWQGIKLERNMDVTSLDGGTSVYLAARALRQTVDSGAVDMSKAAAAAGGESESSEASSDSSHGAF